MLNKDTAVLAGKLFLVTALVALCLALVNRLTEPVIAVNTEKAFQEAQTEVLEGATRFEKTDLSGIQSEAGVRIESLYIGFDGNQVLGYVVSAVCSEGYGGDITVMTGVNSDMTVQRIRVLEMSETPGLGARSQSEEFTDSYIGKTAGMTVVKSKSAGENEVCAISGATITSKAVTKTVNASLDAVRQSVEQGLNAEQITEIHDKVEQVEQETDRQLSENPAPQLEISGEEGAEPSETVPEEEEAETPSDDAEAEELEGEE